jgi:hypothetical protein
MCSLLVGCFIPISIGLLNGFIGLSSVVIVLAGVAGVLLVLGIMLILAAEGVILTSKPVTGHNDPASVQPPSQTGQPHPLLEEQVTASGIVEDSPASYSVHR